jgi:diguanylate cyclase (GGDEF)-like protein
MLSRWLCRDDTDRERLLDMEGRLKPVRTFSFGLIAAALVLAAPWVGWWPLLPLALAAVTWAVADAALERTARPEYVLFAAWTGSVAMIAVAVALAGVPSALAWIAIPVVTLSARFGLGGVIAGVAFAVACLLGAAFIADAGAVLDDPTIVLVPLVVIIAAASLSTALMRSDLHHRSEAVIDPLTGMLNRKALASRVSEISQQSEITGQPVGVILTDLDNFKRVNDSNGHATGDAVLTDIAYMMRKQLRAFDLAYRIGGEEFLVLIPGSNLEECKRLAELLRRTVAANDFAGGTRMTMSFGVSTSAPGERFDYESVFAAADTALYQAKARGRNQVRAIEAHAHAALLADEHGGHAEQRNGLARIPAESTLRA